MKILATADDSGSLKEIVCSRGTDTSSQTAKQPTKIESFNEQGLKNKTDKLLVEDDFIITARSNGQINFYLKESYELIHTVHEETFNNTQTTKDNFVSLIESFGLIFVVSNLGQVTIIDLESVKTEDVLVTHTQLKAPISTFISHPEQVGIFAYGGKENDVKIVKLFKEEEDIFEKESLKVEVLFQGKNVKNDRLDLRVPIHVTNIKFIKLDQSFNDKWDFITTTYHGQIRKYDTSHGRKPIWDKKITEKPILNIASTLNEDEIICSDNHTTTLLFDLAKGVLVTKFKGAVGATQGLYSDGRLLVTGALDRYVRVFDIKSREQVVKVFLGSKVSEVWLLDFKDEITDEEVKQDESNRSKKGKKFKYHNKEQEEEEDEEIWNALDGVEKVTKKRKITSTSS